MRIQLGGKGYKESGEFGYFWIWLKNIAIYIKRRSKLEDAQMEIK